MFLRQVIPEMLTLSIILAILAMVCWGVAPIFSKLGLVKVDPFMALTVRSFSVTVILFFSGLMLGKLNGLAMGDKKSYLFIILEGILAALLGQLAYYYAQKLGDISRVAPIVAAFPVVTVILAVAILGEKFTWSKLIGTLLIISGIIVIKR
ncbi:MAG: EamA family transporter [Bacillota bacterium]